MSNITILGAGTWGVALSRALTNGGHRVTVWSPVPGEAAELSAARVHKNLPDMPIPAAVAFTDDPAAVRGADAVVFAVPSPFVRSTAAAVREHLAPDALVVDVAKGLEEKTFFTMTGIIADEVKKDGMHDGVRLVALSGPTHAEEVARDLPTAIVAASHDTEAARQVQALFSTPFLRVYTNGDPLGVELCGALKNIVALAAGISDGLGYEDNTKAALITRGMAEITRLGRALGCDERTFAGLAGIGDLIVTCTSAHSRNHNAGFLIGQGTPADEAARRVGMVVEGLNALPAAVTLAEKHGVEMPIIAAVWRIVKQNADPRQTVRGLMCREYKDEITHYQD